jgi:hypothetical protein
MLGIRCGYTESKGQPLRKKQACGVATLFVDWRSRQPRNLANAFCRLSRIGSAYHFGVFGEKAQASSILGEKVEPMMH